MLRIAKLTLLFVLVVDLILQEISGNRSATIELPDFFADGPTWLGSVPATNVDGKPISSLSVNWN